MKTALSRPTFIQSWPIIRESAHFGEKFEAFIEKMISSWSMHDVGELQGLSPQPQAGRPLPDAKSVETQNATQQ
jgi:hypothetical protein